MKGGGEPKVIPPFVQGQDPNVPAEQKSLAFKRKEESLSHQKPVAPMVDLKVYPPQQKFQSQSKPQDYPLMMADPYRYPPYPTYLHQLGTFPQIPIVKQYVIQGTGPTGNHIAMNMMYEDVLPTKNFPKSTSTIAERMTIYNFLRSAIFKNQDGGGITFDGGQDSLMGKIKFTEMNPYNYSGTSLTSNPYKSLPNDMIIYRSCYPIQYNATNLTCAKEALSINIKIYKLTIGALMVNRQNKIDYFNYDVWREVAFNEYVREHILAPKICPNLGLLYGYYICEKSKINFEQINKIKGKPTIEEKLYIKNSAGEVELNQKGYRGDVLVSLSEAPTYSIFGWASKVYQIDGTIRRMVNIGFHPDEIWRSIIFQIIAGLYTLQLHRIVINGFSFPNNVFIKDLTTHGTVTNHWKYKVDGMDYYIPNYGFMALIDAYFQDIPQSTSTVIIQDKPTKKINSKIFVDSVDPLDKDENKLYDMAFEVFVNCINPNVFDRVFIENGGHQPSANIIKLLGDIYNKSSQRQNKNIGDYISEYLRCYLNNRIGTFLTNYELAGLTNGKTFAKGDLIVYEERAKVYKFVMYMGQPKDKIGEANVLTKDDPTKLDIVERSIPIGNLSEYSKSFGPKQNYKQNESNLDEGSLLETYVIN